MRLLLHLLTWNKSLTQHGGEGRDFLSWVRVRAGAGAGKVGCCSSSSSFPAQAVAKVYNTVRAVVDAEGGQSLYRRHGSPLSAQRTLASAAPMTSVLARTHAHTEMDPSS